ncbi:MAG TPA: hypothetical protein VLC95_18955 [Anaerolineae bacterium]|nr:hypothetical protein [Anaerolineae bacterium]
MQSTQTHQELTGPPLETIRGMLGAESTAQRRMIDETRHGTPEATV